MNQDIKLIISVGESHITIEVNPMYTILELKQIIYNVMGNSKIELYYDNNLLKDYNQIISYGIHEDAVIYQSSK